MPKAPSVGFLFPLLLASFLSAAEPVATLTLEQALATVDRVSLEVLLSREAATQALEAVRQQRSTVLPILNASVQQRRTQNVSIATVVVASGRPASRFDALVTGNYSLFDPELFRLNQTYAMQGTDVAAAYHQARRDGTLTADLAADYALWHAIQRRESGNAGGHGAHVDPAVAEMHFRDIPGVPADPDANRNDGVQHGARRPRQPAVGIERLRRARSATPSHEARAIRLVTRHAHAFVAARVHDVDAP